MDLARAFSELKSLPDVALKKELASPTGAIPGFMVLGELHERKTMRAGAGGSPDETIKRKSMAEEYMGDIKSMMPSSMQGMQHQAMPPQAVPPPQTASPMGGGIASVPQQHGYAGGGIVGLQSYPENQSYPVQSQAMIRQLVEDPEWEWVREAMANKPRRYTIPFPNEAPIPASRPLEPGMAYEDLLALSAADYPWLPSGNDAPIPPQFPPQRYAQGGIVSLAGGGQVGLREYMRQRAPLYGVDPDYAERVIMSEGGFDNPTLQSYAKNEAGIREPSYGPWQMLIGGPGTGFGKGMGNDALAAGIDPRNPADRYRVIDFGLQQAASGGWSPWMGAKKIGITGKMGINGNPGPVPAGLGATGDLNADVAATAAETAGNMATAETAAATADPMSSYLLMQQLMQQASPTVQPAELPAPVIAQPVGNYREFAQATSMRPDYFERLRNG